MSVKNFGLPYTGSKSRIAPWLMEMLPSCDHFVDVFAGGCAVSHAMIIYGKAKKITLNDLQGDVVNLFIDALHGDLEKYEPYRWIDRETFFKEKDNNPFIRLVYSFGNSGKNYLFSREIEKYRHAIYSAIVENKWIEFKSLCPEVYDNTIKTLEGIESLEYRRLAFQREMASSLRKLNDVDKNIKTKNPLYTYPSTLRGSDCANQLERIKRIIQIKCSSLPSIQTKSLDYRLLDIPNNSVVFCDPPYKDSTVKYNNLKFEHEEFYEWCLEQSNRNDVYVTEYNIEHPNFQLVGEKGRQISMNGKGSKGLKTERLYKVVP